MRLTLRTMLAYLDDVLEPADAKHIGEKIEESEFATGLVNRVRNVNRRLRLGAPPALGTGMGNDPNTVAEYLDNTLGEQEVPEFERVCLESDTHLSEVASCHQILTLVLGEPAQVDPESRKRMYQLLEKGAPAAASATAEKSAESAEAAEAGTEAEAPKRPRQKPEVPEYLREAREGRRKLWWTVAAAALLLVGLGVAVAMTVLPEGLLSVATNDAQDADTAATGEEIDAGDDTADVETPATGEGEATEEETDTPEPGEEGPGEESPDEEGGAPKTAPSEEPGEEPAEEPSEEPASVTEPGDTEPDEGSDKPEEPVPPGETETPTEEPAKKPPAEEPTEDPGATKVLMGRFISDNQVLLVSRQGGEGWKRLPSLESVYPGDELLTLPTFRSTITLTSGITIHVLGGSKIEVLPPDEKKIPGMRLVFGRVVLMTVGKAGTRLRLEAANREGTITFGTAESTVGVKVSPRGGEGQNPEVDPPPKAVELYVDSGEILWDEPTAGAAHVLEPQSRLTLLEAGKDQVTKNLSDSGWIVSDDLSPIEKRASAEMEKTLTVDRPLELTLRELADHRQKETVALAVRCLAYIDGFDLLVRVLSDENQRNFWTEHVETLRDSVRRGPETAAKVREAFEAQRRDDAAALYRMLWGYTAEQLKEDEALRLVNYLNHEDLDFRVLAFWNLRDITGLHLGYQPQYTAVQRRTSVKRWMERYEAGQVVPEEAPPFEEEATPPAEEGAAPDAEQPPPEKAADEADPLSS